MLHIDHIVESQDAVGFHHAVDTVGHAVCPVRHTQCAGTRVVVCACRRCGIAVGMAGFVRRIGDQYKAELFDCFHKGRDDVLRWLVFEVPRYILRFAGLTKRLDRHIIPIKLLLCAIRADSLIDIEARPLLST